MRSFILLLFIVLLSGCSNTNEQTVQFYVLPVKDANQTIGISQSSDVPILFVDYVELADYLNTKSIVYRKSSTQVVQAKRNLWADDVRLQITSGLIAYLREQNTRYRILGADLSTIPSRKLLVSFDKFNGAYTGNAEISGEWRLLDAEGEEINAHSFTIEVPLERDGYEALIFALSSALSKLSQQIAQHL